MVYGQALLRIGLGAIDIELLLNLVEYGFLGGIIGSTETRGTLEHYMLQIVSQTCIIGRVVLSAVPYGDESLKTRSLLIH